MDQQLLIAEQLCAAVQHAVQVPLATSVCLGSATEKGSTQADTGETAQLLAWSGLLLDYPVVYHIRDSSRSSANNSLGGCPLLVSEVRLCSPVATEETTLHYQFSYSVPEHLHSAGKERCREHITRLREDLRRSGIGQPESELRIDTDERVITLEQVAL
mmetsp:Transcript_39845/g.100428  ORF Transcript_39845/g.100428 Transcript_39845/m.100428 type:complete len:159 (+) Transcript_39845:190-666(+)